MEKRVIYCTGCDRDVEVVLRDGCEAGGAHPELAGAACLEAGWRCTGASCPICAVPLEPAQREKEEPAAA